MKLKISNLSSFRIEFSKNSLNCAALRCVALRCVALRCVALRCTALRCDAPQKRKEGRGERIPTCMLFYLLKVAFMFDSRFTHCFAKYLSVYLHESKRKETVVRGEGG